MYSSPENGQGEFDFADCYNANFPALNLDDYKNDRNYDFYVAQEEYIQTGSKKAWDVMYYYIYSVALSTAKKLIKNLKVPDLEGKALEGALTVLEKYKQDHYFRAKKIENVVYWPVKEAIYKPNLQIDERCYSLEAMIIEAAYEEEFLNDEEEND